MSDWTSLCACGAECEPEHDAVYDRMYCGLCFEWLENRCDCDPAGSPLFDMDGNEIAGTLFVCPYSDKEQPDNAEHCR